MGRAAYWPEKKKKGRTECRCTLGKKQTTQTRWILHGVTGFAGSLLQCGLFMGCGFFQGTYTHSSVILHGLQSKKLIPQGFHHRLLGNICFSTWSSSSSTFFIDLGVCRDIPLTFLKSSLPAFLKYVIIEVVPTSLAGSASTNNRSVSQPAGNSSAQHDVFS